MSEPNLDPAEMDQLLNDLEVDKGVVVPDEDGAPHIPLGVVRKTRETLSRVRTELEEKTRRLSELEGSQELAAVQLLKDAGMTHEEIIALAQNRETQPKGQASIEGLTPEKVQELLAIAEERSAAIAEKHKAATAQAVEEFETTTGLKKGSPEANEVADVMDEFKRPDGTFALTPVKAWELWKTRKGILAEQPNNDGAGTNGSFSLEDLAKAASVTTQPHTRNGSVPMSDVLRGGKRLQTREDRLNALRDDWDRFADLHMK